MIEVLSEKIKEELVKQTQARTGKVPIIDVVLHII